MNIFLILLGQTKEISLWKRQELFSAGNWPVKNSSCLQIYFQASDTVVVAKRKLSGIARKIEVR